MTRQKILCMQENNFEQNVRQKLDELHLTPSEPVWQKVEASIKKKRERRLLLWLLPLMLLTSGLVWWQISSHPITDVAQHETRPTTRITKPTFSKPHTIQAIQTNKKAVAKPENTVVINQTSAFKPIVIKKAAVIHHVVRGQQQTSEQTETLALTKKTTSNKNKAVTFSTKTTEKTTAVKENNLAQHTTKESKSNTTNYTDTLQQTKTTAPDSVAKVFQQTIKKNTNQKKLQWSIASRIGMSNTVGGLFIGFGAKSLDQYYPNASYNSGGTTNVGYPSGYDSTGYRQAATPTKGIHFSIGARAKKSIGKTSFLIAGLQYSFYSNHLNIGTELPADSAIGTTLSDARQVFRNNGNHNQFTNTFHFIELPVGLEYQLFKNIPLHVQHGITISQLVASKALQYDYATNRYYQRSAAVPKTGLSLFTGIDYTILKERSFSLQAGPHVQYGLQPLFKNLSGNHLFSGSMAVYMTF
jgi:hypothetical protein